jgi:hypothetical protein
VKELRLRSISNEGGGQRLCAPLHGGLQRSFWQGAEEHV